MEEGLSENELDERLYSILHYADDTQENLNVNQKDVWQIVENAPRSTVRRYWKTNEENCVYQKVNTPKIPPANKNIVAEKTEKPSTVKRDVVLSPPSANLLSMFQSPVSQSLKKTIEIVENHDEVPQVVAIESSDDDEIIEVTLPPKPTITIESSDEEEVCAITKVKPKDLVKDTASPDKKSPAEEREVTASPVPSVVSSVSDEFIRGDCIALNISSRHPNKHSFDFSLHGSDLLIQMPSKKKKKKKNRDAVTSTPNTSTICNTPSTTGTEECFATPKSKAKNKRQKNKSYHVSAKSLPNPDVYDSDSNQSVSESNKNASTIDGNKSINNLQSDTNTSENFHTKQAMTSDSIDQADKVVSNEKHEDVNAKTPKQNEISVVNAINIVDLTDTPEKDMSLISIDENIVIGNVSGFSEQEENNITLSPDDAPKLGSTKVPDILYADLDFDNLNGKERASKRRRYSLTTLRAEMEKFYNESWGGENFNHREIQKYMSRDKSLWVIDPKDRISALTKRRLTCNYCNRPGHRDDTCRMKPPVCYMCGSMGHNEPRCPRKICVNCGSPNHMYSSMCRNCCQWHGITCAECGQNGHPSSHCPDLWRRYHNTISEDTPLEENHQSKKHYQMFCSGCTRRGHLVHTCRVSLPFSGLPINSPYVTFYNPIYPPINANQSVHPTGPLITTQNRNIQKDDTITSGTTLHRTDRNKRQSKSPVVHETHVNKKRNLSDTETPDIHVTTKSLVNSGQKRKSSQSKDLQEAVESNSKDPINNDQKTVTDEEKLPDFIPLFSGNHDKQGQIIQDNEVSDTSDVVTSARIYVTDEIMEKLNTPEGIEWLNTTAEKNNVAIEKTNIISFLSIKGTVGDQEAFQTELRDWINNKLNGESPKFDNNYDCIMENNKSLSNNIPKNRNNVLRVINRALDSLKDNLGDPKSLFKELNFLQNRHLQLLKQKEISPKQLANNRTNMNSIFRKLNMVLLGQAGLADGPKHLNELCTLHEKITNLRHKNITAKMRQEIGQHFHCIFAAIPREDYADLLTKYYVSRNTQLLSKNKKSAKLKLQPIPKENINMKELSKNDGEPTIDMISKSDIIDFKKPQIRSRPLVQKTLNKLVFYHRRLLNVKPIDAGLKKTRKTLVNRLHAQIAALSRNRNVSAKTLRKAKKIQEQAHLFLASSV